MTQDTPAAPNHALQARAIALHEKAFMPWADAEALALSEAGVDDAMLDELIGEAKDSNLLSLLDDEDVRAFVRTMLVHQPAALAPPTSAAPQVPAIDLIPWDQAHRVAYQAAAAFRPSYFDGPGFIAHSWVVEAIRSAHMDGQLHARGLPPIDRGFETTGRTKGGNQAATFAAGGATGETREELLARIDDLQQQVEEEKRGPWPEWAEKVLAVIRKHSGYDGYDDMSEGIDLAAELDELLEDMGRSDTAALAAQSPAAPDPDGEAFRTAAHLGLTLRFYGGCAQSGMPGSPSAYEVVNSQDRAAAMREAVQRAAVVIGDGGEPQRVAAQIPDSGAGPVLQLPPGWGRSLSIARRIHDTASAQANTTEIFTLAAAILEVDRAALAQQGAQNG